MITLFDKIKAVFKQKNSESDHKKLANELLTNGWAVLDSYSGDLLKLVVQICAEQDLEISLHNHKNLVPKDKNETNYFSLSSAYGLKKFPLHTDGAEFSVPPKYIVMRALTDSHTGTTLADASTLKSNSVVSNSVWQVKTKTGLITACFFEMDHNYNMDYIRFNRLSMKSVEGEKFEILKAIDSLPTTTITWTKNKTLLIDNWRMLHGRQSVKETAYENRILERLQVFI